MSVSVSLKAQYIGLRDGRNTYDITVSVPADAPEGVAHIRGVTTDDLLSGREFITSFVAYGQPDFKFGKVGHSKKRLRRAATSQERRTAEALGGRRQTGSGARPGYAGDGRVMGKYRIENKFTQNASFSLKLSDLTKIRSECEGLEVPIYEVEFLDKHTLKPKEKWALVPWSEWEKLANAANNDS